MLGAIISGVVQAGGALLSSSAQKKAANRAADAQIGVARENNALAQNMYGQNTANMSPYLRSGQMATQTLNGLLYGSTQPMGQTQGFGAGVPAEMASYGGGPATGYAEMPSLGEYRDMNPGATMGQFQGQQFGQPQPINALAQTPQQAPQQQAPNGQSAWDQFRNGTNYQFRLNEGLRALNTGYASRGMLDSGAAMKGIVNYGQNMASNELGNYMNLLQGQQNIGMGSASALAGVGQNMVGMQSNNNQNAADATSNAALLRAQAQQQMYGGFANALGGLASSYLQPSYRK